jgi:hypothetical protein
MLTLNRALVRCAPLFLLVVPAAVSAGACMKAPESAVMLDSFAGEDGNGSEPRGGVNSGGAGGAASGGATAVGTGGSPSGATSGGAGGGTSGGGSFSGAQSTTGGTTASGGRVTAGGAGSASGGAGAGMSTGGVRATGGASAGGAATGGRTTGGASAGGGADGKSGGCRSDLLLCEDFESTAVGKVPTGWTRHGEDASVSDDDAHGGGRSLKLSAAASAERRIYHDAGLLGRAHWGRIFYKVQTPIPDAFVHSTMVSFLGDGPKNGVSEYRTIDTIKQDKKTRDVGSRHNFIYNVQIVGKSEFGRETNYDYNFDAMWHCAEYHIDAANQSYALYLDSKQILSFEDGAGNYDDSDIPDQFDELRVGWINYQDAPPGFTAWIDDIAFDDARVGCE